MRKQLDKRRHHRIGVFRTLNIPGGGGAEVNALYLSGISQINCGSEASLDDFKSNAFTFEIWTKDIESYCGVFRKGVRISLSASTSGRLICSISCSTTNASAESPISFLSTDDGWHHYVVFYNNAGDRKPYLAKDGIWVNSYRSQVAGDGDIVSDAAENFLIGGLNNIPIAVSWFRLSNNDRYNHEVNFTPSEEFPENDVNTIRLFYANEGEGTTLIDYSANAQNATITLPTWIKKN